MQYNHDPSFVGLTRLKEAHKAQIDEFEIWAAANEWMNFHHAHYDWWTFPINLKSSYGLKWTVFDGEIAELKQDAAFIRRYLRGLDLVAAAWGWDAPGGDYLDNPQAGQNWQNWPVRLFKAALSVQLFGYMGYFSSLKKFACILMDQGEDFSFNGHDLSWLFK